MHKNAALCGNPNTLGAYKNKLKAAENRAQINVPYLFFNLDT